MVKYFVCNIIFIWYINHRSTLKYIKDKICNVMNYKCNKEGDLDHPIPSLCTSIMNIDICITMYQEVHLN